MFRRPVTLQALAHDERGQTMVEYAVVLGLLVLGTVAVIGLLTTAIIGRFGSVASIITDLAP